MKSHTTMCISDVFHFVQQGQFFSVEGAVIYLLGNPIIWWGHCLFFFFYFILWVVNAVIEKRSAVLSDKQMSKFFTFLKKSVFFLSWLIIFRFFFLFSKYLVLQRRTLNTCKWLFIGFLCHYAPFWPMARILYFHHYFPALLFSNMISGN